jgi:hypothetical protein
MAVRMLALRAARLFRRTPRAQPVKFGLPCGMGSAAPGMGAIFSAAGRNAYLATGARRFLP